MVRADADSENHLYPPNLNSIELLIAGSVACIDNSHTIYFLAGIHQWR